MAASVVAPIVRGTLHPQAVSLAELAPVHGNGVVVCYLRSNFRCSACSALDAISRDVVELRFAAEFAAGTVTWKPIDYQTPGNEHFVSDFELPTGGVVLVNYHGGQLTRWKALLHAWNLTDDRAALASYLETAIREFREESQ